MAGYVVIRPAADLPAGFLPDRYDGLWLDRETMPVGEPPGSYAGRGLGEAIAVATGRFETREDGATAEVYEVRP